MKTTVIKERLELGEMMASNRLRAGLSQKKLAKKIKLNSQIISNYERGICAPPLTQIKRLCYLTNTSRVLVASKLIQIQRNKVHKALGL